MVRLVCGSRTQQEKQMTANEIRKSVRSWPRGPVLPNLPASPPRGRRGEIVTETETSRKGETMNASKAIKAAARRAKNGQWPLLSAYDLTPAERQRLMDGTGRYTVVVGQGAQALRYDAPRYDY